MRARPDVQSALRGTLLAALALAVAAPAEAQDSRAFCRAGRPAPDCATFLVATLNYFPGGRGETDGPVSWNLVEWDVGVMTNRGRAGAVGASVGLGTSDTGFHLSVKGRYRHWLGDGLALDAGAGLMIAQHPPRTYPHETIAGPTADVSLGLTDWAAVTARGHVLWGASDGEAVAAVDLGVRLGTVPGLIATVVGAAVLISEGVGAS